MGISKYLSESILPKDLDKPLFTIDKSFKGWMSTVNKVLKKVPKAAIPDIVCAFSQLNVLTNSKVISPNINRTKNGVSMDRDTLHLPIALAKIVPN